MMRLVLMVAVLGASGAMAQGAPASAEAAARFQHGVRAFAAGDYPAALSEFEQVYQQLPRASVLYNLALTWGALGEPQKAVEAYDRVLATPGGLDATRLARAKELREAQMAKLGTLKVTSSVPGTVIDLDNQTVGRSPFTGPIVDQSGNVRVKKGKAATGKQIAAMNYLVEGVVGSIPK